MPELPEVETIRRDLEAVLPGKTITGLSLLWERAVLYPSCSRFRRDLLGKTITGIRRRGKYLLLLLTGEKLLVIHLRMTGQLLYTPVPLAIEPSTRAVFFLGEAGQLHFRDQRKFGTMWLVKETDRSLVTGLCRLGPEPLSPSFTEKTLADLLKKRGGRKIKALLLDQECLAGLGNIYTDEILYRSRLHPARKAQSLSGEEKKELYHHLRETLNEAIRCRGTSIRDFRDTEGKEGAFQQRLRVYRRQGESCFSCGSPVERMLIAGRGTYFCPRCQPLQREDENAHNRFNRKHRQR